MTPSDLDAVLAQLAEGHWPRPTAELGRAIVERIRGLEARADRLAVENAELRDVLGDAVDAHTTDEVLARAMAVLNRPADMRGADRLAVEVSELIDAAEVFDAAYELLALNGDRGPEPLRRDVTRARATLARLRALGVVGEE